MNAKRGRKRKNITTYFGDFETTKQNKEGRVRVYLWAIVSKKYEAYGLNIASFFEEIEKLDNAIIFFRNGSNFDFNFILSYLLENKINYEMLEKNSTIYQISLYDGRVLLRDSIHLIPLSLKESCKQFNQKYFKTSIDYETQYDHKATVEEIEYCLNDVRCDEEAVNNFYNLLDEILTEMDLPKTRAKMRDKMTISGIAFSAFVESTRGLYEKVCKPNTYNDKFVRQSYNGGFVFFKKGLQKNLEMDDNNSMYPFQYAYKMLPIGCGFYKQNFENLKQFELYIIHFRACFKLKEGFEPIIPKSKNFRGFCGENYTSEELDEPMEIFCTNWDFERYKKYYDFFEFEFIDGIGFRGCPNFYKDYAEKLIEFKKNYTGGKRYVVKLLLNSPYGKLGMNGDVDIYDYQLNEKGILQRVYKGHENDIEAFNYLPQAVFITSGGRQTLWDRCEEIGWNNCFYGDTDSVKYKHREGLELEKNSKNLGKWKEEGRPELFKAIAPKKYIYFENGLLNVACAGFHKDVVLHKLAELSGLDNIEERQKDENGELMPSSIKCNKEEAEKMIAFFDKGLRIEQLQKKKVDGGCVLYNGFKEIK